MCRESFWKKVSTALEDTETDKNSFTLAVGLALTFFAHPTRFLTHRVQERLEQNIHRTDVHSRGSFATYRKYKEEQR